MKKYILAAAFAFIISFSPITTQAAGLTSEQIQAILSLLTSFGADSATIASVNTALTGGTSGGGGDRFCYTFNKDLTVGSSGGDIFMLNDVLATEGFNKNGNSSIFDENTAAQVVSFQAKYGIRQTGYVGPITRTKLNALYGCPPAIPPHSFPPQPSPITVLSPNGGEAWMVGETHTIRWSSQGTVVINSPVQIGIIDTRYSTEIGPRAEQIIAYSIPNTGSYSWTVPQSVGTMNLGDTYLPVYKIIVHSWSDSITGIGLSDVSNAPFSFVSASTTLSVKMALGLMAPEGTDTVPYNSQFYVSWDAPGATSCSTSGHYVPLVDKGIWVNGVLVSGDLWTDFRNLPAHGKAELYARHNTYGYVSPLELSIQCYDDKGASARDSVSLKVAPPTTTAAPVTLSSILPASGPVGTSVRLDGCGSDSLSGFTLVYSGPKSGTAVGPARTLGAASGCGYMTFTVPTDFPAGTYTLSVKNNQTGAMSTNTMTFTVTAPTVTATPILTASPSSFTAGTKMVVSVTSGLPNAPVLLTCTNDTGAFCSLGGTSVNQLSIGSTDGLGTFSIAYNTTSWTAGTRTLFVSIGGVKSNTAAFTVTALTTTTAPVLTASPPSFAAGTPLKLSVANATPNIDVLLTCKNGIGAYCVLGGASVNQMLIGKTDSSGAFSLSYNTSSWTAGTRTAFVTVNNTQSNTATFTVTASTTSLLGGAGQTASVLNAVGGFASNNPAPQAATQAFSYIWNNNLQIGSPFTEDIKALQTALTRDGEYAGDITGGFYNQTYLAVKAFQQKYNIDATGFVGQLTRTKLNSLFAR